jgi:hypothetical protein
VASYPTPTCVEMLFMTNGYAVTVYAFVESNPNNGSNSNADAASSFS